MGQPSIVEILAGIAETERVSAFLAGYDERDEAIEQLVNDVIRQRLTLANELATRLVPGGRVPLRA
jgi:hypothetical protein